MTSTIDQPSIAIRRQFLHAAALSIFFAAAAFSVLCVLLLIIIPSVAIAAYAGMVVIVGAGSALSLRWLRRHALGLAVAPLAASFVLTVVAAWALIPDFNVVGALVLTIVVLLVSISGNRAVTLGTAVVCALLAMLVLGVRQPATLLFDAAPILELAKTLSGGAIVLVIWLIADRYTTSQDSALALAEQRAAEAETARAEAEAGRIEIEARSSDQQRLLELVQTLELPIIPIGRDVLVAPMVGSLDSRRVVDIQRRLLEEVARQRARTVVLDVTGISVIDTEVARGLLNTAQAVRLLGAQTLISGISASVAQTLVSLGVGFDAIHTVSDLGQALERIREAQAARPNSALDR